MSRSIRTMAAMIAAMLLLATLPGLAQSLASENPVQMKLRTQFAWSNKVWIERLRRGVSAGRTTLAPGVSLGQDSSSNGVTQAGALLHGSSTNRGSIQIQSPPTLMNSKSSSTMEGTLLSTPTTQAPSANRNARIGQSPGTHPVIAGLHPRVPCAAGIRTIANDTLADRLKPNQTYRIYGCGFGADVGEVYVTGLDYQPQLIQPQRPLHAGWVKLIVAPGQWSDTEIVAKVDPSATGVYDSRSAILQVFPKSGPPLSKGGLTFEALRAEQRLPYIPIADGPSGPVSRPLSQNNVLRLIVVRDMQGNPVPPHFISPSDASILLPGHTFAVVREDNSAPFLGSSDVLNLQSVLHLGFQVHSLTFYSDTPSSNNSGDQCSSWSSNGNWSNSIQGEFQITAGFQEQSCGANGVSVYAIDVVVIGPVGTKPF